jgi:hypothetical protein
MHKEAYHDFEVRPNPSELATANPLLQNPMLSQLVVELASDSFKVNVDIG